MNAKDFGILVAIAGLGLGAAHADEEPGLWARTGQRLDVIAEQPGWDVYLTGYAHHSRSTYSRERLARLNEEAWGGGVGKTWRNGAGNDESLYLMVFRNSRFQPQWIGGYAYAWTVAPDRMGGLELGAGLTVAVTRRSDWVNGAPVPVALPVLSVGSERGKLMMTFVPHISTGAGKGNVALFFLKLGF